LASEFEAVTVFADGEDVTGSGGIVFEFAAEFGDVRVHGATNDGGGIAPNFAQELETADDGAAGAEECEQKTELFGGELDGLRSAANRAGGDVNFYVAEAVDFVSCDGRAWRGLGAAEKGFDAGEKFEEAEGLCNVIVGAHAEAANFIEFFAFRGEEEHGSCVIFLAKRFENAKAIELGKHDVENDEVWFCSGEGFQPGNAIARDVHFVAFDFEIVAEAEGEIAIVFDDENAAHEAASRWAWVEA
jgi:hypothetical protein